MSLYFIDGYNVIRSADWLSAGALRDQRDRLLRFIEGKRPQGRHDVTVVFDGREDVVGVAWTGPSRVIFSRGRDADQVIKDQVDHLPNPREAVVVTNDRAIQKWVRGVGAKVMSCEDFIAAAGARAAPRRRAEILNPQDAADINEELKRLWKLK